MQQLYRKSHTSGMLKTLGKLKAVRRQMVDSATLYF